MDDGPESRGSAAVSGAGTDQARLIEALMAPERYPHPVERVERMETHISTILLAGEHAYKIKKPLDLGFLDFTDLERRGFYCDEELRLNRRYAPELYLARIAITGSVEAPVLGGEGGVLEYAVHMRRFPQDALLSQQLADGALTPAMMDRLARRIADFHAEAARAPEDADYGTPARVAEPVDETLDAVARTAPAAHQAQVRRLTERTGAETERLTPQMAERRGDGRIRECHGDLHLDNILLWQDELVPFDGIEFDPQLRWIDVLNDIAFTLMDLDRRGAGGLSARLKNAYLERCGDYGGLGLLRYYQAYRALVRAKIAAYRADQMSADDDARPAQLDALAEHLDLAEAYGRTRQPRLVVTCGLSGSGKSTVAQHLVDALRFVRLRSDVERKRLFGLEATAASGSAVGGGIYQAGASERTYARLGELAAAALDAGESVVVDAAFLQPDQRAPFADLAAAHGLPLQILRIDVPVDTLRERLGRRRHDAAEASEAGTEVLDYQLEHAVWPEAGEGRVIPVATDAEDWRARLVETLAADR